MQSPDLHEEQPQEIMVLEHSAQPGSTATLDSMDVSAGGAETNVVETGRVLSVSAIVDTGSPSESGVEDDSSQRPLHNTTGLGQASSGVETAGSVICTYRVG